MLLAREEHAQSRCSEGEGKSDRAEDVSAETRIRSAEDASAETSSDASRPSRADAMVALAESYLAGNTGTGNGGERFQVMVHLDQDPLAPDGVLSGTLDDGTRVSAETLRRVSCDCGIVTLASPRLATRAEVDVNIRSPRPATRAEVDVNIRSPRPTKWGEVDARSAAGEHLCFWSRSNLCGLPVRVGAQHGVEDGEQLAHTGDDGDLLELSCGN